MAESPGKLGGSLSGCSALEKQGQAGGKAGTVGARLAMHERRRAQRGVDIGEAQDTVAMRRTTRLERHVYVIETQPVRSIAGKRV